jgi:hypothetical protein
VSLPSLVPIGRPHRQLLRASLTSAVGMCLLGHVRCCTLKPQPRHASTDVTTAFTAGAESRKAVLGPSPGSPTLNGYARAASRTAAGEASRLK